MCHKQNGERKWRYVSTFYWGKGWTPKKQGSDYYYSSENMRSMHSSEKIEELETDFEGYRWDAIFLNETWKNEPAELWETQHKHIFVGAGTYDNKHGVGIMLNKRWRKRIIDTEYINERAVTTTILVNRQHIKLMSVSFPHSKYADHHIEKMYKTIEKHMMNSKKYIPIIGGDFNAELGFGKGTNKLITSCSREDAWGMWSTLRPTTWSTWEVTIDVSWLFSWS